VGVVLAHSSLGRPSAEAVIMAREAKAEFLGHQIVVRNVAISTKLYIDGALADSCQTLMDRGTIMMSVITENGKRHIVEVRRPFIFSKPRILVDGKELASS
jgi:hypothetical protein